MWKMVQNFANFVLQFCKIWKMVQNFSNVAKKTRLVYQTTSSSYYHQFITPTPTQLQQQVGPFCRCSQWGGARSVTCRRAVTHLSASNHVDCWCILIIFHLDVILFVRCLLLFFFASLYHCMALNATHLSAIGSGKDKKWISLLAASRREILVCVYRCEICTLISLACWPATKEFLPFYQWPTNVWHRNVVQW